MNTDRIKHYIFDLYGTLVDIHTDEEKPEVWAKMSSWFEERGIYYQPEHLKQTFRSEIVRQENGYSEKGHLKNDGIEKGCKETESEGTEFDEKGYPEISLENVFRTLFLNRGFHPSNQDIQEAGHYFRKISTEYIRLYPGAVELLKQLQKQGKEWLLTNAQSLFTRPELAALNIESYFDGIYISSEQRFKKPDARFFKALLDGEKILPEQAVMIGNDEFCDISGAKNVGLSTVYLHSNLSPDFQGSAADLVLNPLDLEKLTVILKKPEEPGKA